jgi:hypothetical protein
VKVIHEFLNSRLDHSKTENKIERLLETRKKKFETEIQLVQQITFGCVSDRLRPSYQEVSFWENDREG